MMQRSPRRTQVLVALVAVVAMTTSLALRLWVFPQVDEPGTADAVIVLGGGGARERFGLDLIADRVAPTLVFFTPFVADVGYYGVRSCNGRPDQLADDIELECFIPDPRTTRGEVRRISQLAEERGWEEIVVVASTDQITRARMLLARCWDGGEARFTGPDHDDPWWARVAYEAGATVKALLTSGC